LFQYRCVELAHTFIFENANRGGIYVDATCGHGNDTRFLLNLTEGTGKVLAFDIQKEAILRTKKTLSDHPFKESAFVYLDSHENIDRYTSPDTVDCIMFNLGYLPGRNHQIRTEAQTTISTLEKCLMLLAPGGIISIISYYGKDTSSEEKDALLSYLPAISDAFIVFKTELLNHQNNPPINFFIIKK